MTEEPKRGPGRPRKTPEEPMDNMPEVKITPAEVKPDFRLDAPKVYTFKLLKGTNFPAPVMIIDVDEDGEWKAPRLAGPGEYGPQSKIWPGTIVQVDGNWAKRFDKFNIAKRIDNYE